MKEGKEPRASHSTLTNKLHSNPRIRKIRKKEDLIFKRKETNSLSKKFNSSPRPRRD